MKSSWDVYLGQQLKKPKVKEAFEEQPISVIDTSRGNHTGAIHSCPELGGRLEEVSSAAAFELIGQAIFLLL